MSKGTWVNISPHAFARAKERFGWDRDTTKKKAIEAVSIGDVLPEELKEFYIYKSMPSPEFTKLFIFEENCYVFSTKERIMKLITIYPIKSTI